MSVNLTLYEVLKELGVSAEQARHAAELELGIIQVEERMRSMEVQLAKLKWIIGAVGAGVIVVIGMLCNVLMRLP